MKRVFIETSALAKLFVREAGTDEVLALVEAAEESAVSALAEFEFLSVIQRRRADGDITAIQYEQLRTEFYARWGECFVQQPLSDAVMGKARILLGSYRLRTLDAFQLASAITYALPHEDKPMFLTFDRQLAEVAEREGFVIA